MYIVRVYVQGQQLHHMLHLLHNTGAMYVGHSSNVMLGDSSKLIFQQHGSFLPRCALKQIQDIVSYNRAIIL